MKERMPAYCEKGTGKNWMQKICLLIRNYLQACFFTTLTFSMSDFVKTIISEIIVAIPHKTYSEEKNKTRRRFLLKFIGTCTNI